MTARENLNEMKQFMDIARGDLPQINESQLIDLGGVTHHKNRVPIQYYDEFKANNPGSRIRFRGPRQGKAHTSKVDATHFYIERMGPERPRPEDMDRIQKPEPEGMRAPHRPEDAPHTPGYNKQGSGGRAAADSRASAFIFDDVNDDEMYYGEEEEAAYDDLKTRISKELILDWMEDYELVDGTAKIDDAVYDWFITKYIDDQVENFDGEQWHNWLTDFVADNRAITEDGGDDLGIGMKPADHKRVSQSYVVKRDKNPVEYAHNVESPFQEKLGREYTTNHDSRKEALAQIKAEAQAYMATFDDPSITHERGSNVWQGKISRDYNYSEGSFDQAWVLHEVPVKKWVEGIKLDSIVEAVLEEFEGQPKDYEDSEDKADEPTPQHDDDYSSEIEDEELGLRFD